MNFMKNFASSEMHLLFDKASSDTFIQIIDEDLKEIRAQDRPGALHLKSSFDLRWTASSNMDGVHIVHLQRILSLPIIGIG